MIYGDTIIQSMIRRGLIKNVYEGSVNPASINIRLGNTFLVPKTDQLIELGKEIEYDSYDISDLDGIGIGPGEFMLATTKEYFELPITTAAFVQGRSSIGRASLTIQNAGFVDPGFYGHITLELKNEGPCTIFLKEGYPVGQMIFMEAGDVSRPYQGKYNGQVEATGSRMINDEHKPEKQKEVKE